MLVAAAFPGAVLAQPRDTVTVGMAIEPAGLDPTAAAPVAIGQVTWQNIYEGLTRIDRDGAVQPQLAREWSISEDGLTYVFTLRDDVSFSNGVAFTAETAKFTLDRARGEASTNPQKQFFATILSVEATDPQTLTVTLSQPTGNLLYWLAWPAAVMVEPGSAATNNVRPVGTGPFELAEWRQGDRIELRRRDDYWNPDDRPALAAATFRFLADPQAQAAAIRSGDIDAIPEFAAPELYAALEDEADLTTVVGNTELKVVAGLNGRKAPFDDPRVRQALMMAVDRNALIEGVHAGYGEPIGSHYTPNDPGYVDLTAVHPYDPAAAKRLLAEAGYPDGFSLSIKTPQMSYAIRSAEVLQAFLAEIGVTLEIVPTEFPARWVDEVFTRHDFDMTIVAHAEPLDIGIYARPDYYFGYANPAFDAAIVAAETATDPEERLARYGDAQRILADEVPALYLFVMPKLGVWNAALTGLWENEPIPSNDLTDVAWSN
ncbi:ABC transporter substrate-binding protein [Aurantimonas sp. HBX-1]|nr:ABC transporter substrate-binding protein [Aurantimonas sp. HBX-1]UIJ74175.1 ABC transporter substrate-binding protein [Aurantimonas sp. HBX-1]